MPDSKRLIDRRAALAQAARCAVLLASAGALPQWAWAFHKQAFDAKGVNEAVLAMGGQLPLPSKEVVLQAPDVAENGAAVQIALACSLPGVRQLLVLVDKNPSALAAAFQLSEAVEASVTTRIKMAQTAEVFAVAVLADGKTFFSKKEVKVTLGGCGV